jgi:hypothetical protein
MGHYSITIVLVELCYSIFLLRTRFSNALIDPIDQIQKSRSVENILAVIFGSSFCNLVGRVLYYS